MMKRTRTVALAMAIAGTAMATAARADMPPPESAPHGGVVDAPAMAGLVGASEVKAYALPAGFFDDPVQFDTASFGYVQTDGAGVERIVVGGGAELKGPVTFDVSALTTHVGSWEVDGKAIVVIGTTEDGEPIAGRVGLDGKVGWRLTGATALTFVTRDKRRVVAAYHRVEDDKGSKHTAEIYALGNGKRIGAPHTLALDPLGKSASLDFRLGYLTDGFTRAVGVKGGKLHAKVDQREPDSEQTYDLIAGKFVDKKDIPDLYAQRKRFDAVTKANGKLSFVAWTQDLSGLEMWSGGVRVDVALDQSILPYDQQSLQYGFIDGAAAGGPVAWIALQVEPMNATAIKKKTRDAAFFDLFAVGADGKATRRIRVPAEGKRFRFGTGPNGQLWLLERNRGFDRGGARLSVLQPS